MIHGIIEIGDKPVREVMIPRTDIVAVDREDQLRDLVKLFKEYRHTRMPVYEDNIDHVIGLIHCKDLLLFYTLSSSQKFDIDKILRPILYVPEQKKVDELLNEMRVKKQHMMVVVDEYGGTAGLVTLEDLLEEIVGEIRDEYDTAEQDQLQILTDHEARVDAGFPLEELNERLHLGLEESGDYGEAGRIFTLLTRDHGKVGAIAKGVRRPSSKLGPSLELYGHIDVLLAKGRGDLDVLAQVERVPGYRIEGNVLQMAHAALIAELAERVCEDRHPIDGVYELAVMSLDELSRESDPRRASAWFLMTALDLLGYAPQLLNCASCERPLSARPAAFSAEAGGVLCDPGAVAAVGLVPVAAVKGLGRSDA